MKYCIILLKYNMRSEKQREEAERMRSEGKTYKEISAVLGVPKGTLSNWFGNEPWSIELKKRILKDLGKSRLEAVNIQRKKTSVETQELAVREAHREFELFSKEALFIAGLTSYWSEGDKKSKYQVRITNSDAEKVALFRRFLTAYAGIDHKRFWASLIIYADANPDFCLAYWERAAGISKSEFRKTSVLRGAGSGTKSMNGICVYGVSSTILKTKMLIWIAELKKRLYS
jgi:hypothetical protein